ncbi:MAG: F420-0:Gamma-glutamyl ligase [Negativicutes bacterium]|mgnify:FL=1|nr:F420-0:Gamma-glutamyl ligase [Negativicutes bacterium]
MSNELIRIPVKTRVLVASDDIVAAIRKYTPVELGPDDVVTVAESVLAITQKRIVWPADLTISTWARLACRCFPQAASISSPQGMQILMNAEGTIRVLGALFFGALAKVVGKTGLFYQLAGREAPLIDDITGTMPPYDKHVVLGPSHADREADKIAESLGIYGAAIMDVNDLRRALVVGVSETLEGDTETLSQMLLDNPFGNASEKTPIIVLKNYRRATSQLPLWGDKNEVNRSGD